MHKIEFYKTFTNTIPGTNAHGMEADIFFEELSMAGLEEMHRYSIDERFYEFMEFKPFKTKEETKKYLQKLLNRMAGEFGEKIAMYWFVRRKKDNYLIGTAGLVNLNYERKSIEWGYGIDPQLWGLGYILQIQEILKHFVFIELHLNRLDGLTMIHNERTISSLKASGMLQEGIIREYYCKEGQFIDGWKYSMLKSDFLSENNQLVEKRKSYTVNEIINVISLILEDEGINEDSSMFNTANWDSLNHMSIMVALFERTKIQLSPIQISNATSVKAIEQLLVGKIVTV